MSARLTHRQADLARSTIQVEKILLSLQRCLDGSNDLSSRQINAARILLEKALPSLTATVISTDAPELMPMLKIVPSGSA